MSALKVGDLVRIGRGRKVYQISLVRGDGSYILAASAWHPDAAQRVPDAFRAYRADELTAASNQIRPRRDGDG